MSRVEEEIKQSLQKVVSIGKTQSPIISSYSYQDKEVLEPTDEMSGLQELSHKIDLCLKTQQRVHFITKEIAEIIKKQS